MRIVELGENSMVIMKDSDDPPWSSVGDYYRDSTKRCSSILVDKDDQLTHYYLESSEFIYTAGRLILYFKDTIPSRFKVNDKVFLVSL